MANEVFFFDSSDVGAPTLNNVAGSMVSVLDACLVNGFNSKSVTSIVVASNVATVTCTSHGFVAVPGKYVEIAGATPSGLNGKKVVASVPNANTFTFATSGISDQTATGTITAKRAGIGWTKAFTGTNKAVYKSSDVASTGLYLRLDDTNSSPATATDARAVMYESMTDVDTGTNPCPTATQLASGQFWNRGANTSTAKLWVLVGDGRFFYFGTQASTNTQVYLQCFGDIVSYRAADAYGCILAGGASAYGGVSTASCPPAINQSPGSMQNTYGIVLSRIAAQTGTCVRAQLGSMGGSGVVFGGSGFVYPSPVDNGIVIIRPLYLMEENSAFGHPIRGEMPGLLNPLANQAFAHLDQITGITGFTGTALVTAINSGGASGRIMFDISNAWR